MYSVWMEDKNCKSIYINIINELLCMWYKYTLMNKVFEPFLTTHKDGFLCIFPQYSLFIWFLNKIRLIYRRYILLFGSAFTYWKFRFNPNHTSFHHRETIVVKIHRDLSLVLTLIAHFKFIFNTYQKLPEILKKKEYR